MAATSTRRQAGSPVVFTANRLRDGRVVWLGVAGWVEQARQARLFAPEAKQEGEAAARAAEAAQLVVGAYAVPSAAGADGPVLLAQRERIRALGPSTEKAA